MKGIEKNLLELEKSISKLEKYYDYDNTEYIGIRDIENLFNPIYTRLFWAFQC